MDRYYNTNILSCSFFNSSVADSTVFFEMSQSSSPQIIKIVESVLNSAEIPDFKEYDHEIETAKVRFEEDSRHFQVSLQQEKLDEAKIYYKAF